jgi:hypothetical protein
MDGRKDGRKEGKKEHSERGSLSTQRSDP